VATIRLHLPAVAPDAADRSYDIHVGRGLLAAVGPAVKAAGAGRAVVIADAAVAPTHAAVVERALREAGVATALLTVPAGEASKSISGVGRVWDALAEMAVDRRTHLVAVGGGVVGDLAGFAAATFGRGIAVWQVPTTVVAQVDSAIGGKTGINLPAGKNLVGAFWQPRGVFADIDALATLPDREFVSGFAEVVKYGMILDEAFFAWLEEHAAAVRARDPAALLHAVERSAALKAGVVEQDERELTGLRAVLNYGHTFAHAYETAAGYGTLLHGEAVAIGMARAARLAGPDRGRRHPAAGPAARGARAAHPTGGNRPRGRGTPRRDGPGQEGRGRPAALRAPRPDRPGRTRRRRADRPGAAGPGRLRPPLGRIAPPP
jgi:3-dehydroquinate synthase